MLINIKKAMYKPTLLLLIALLAAASATTYNLGATKDSTTSLSGAGGSDPCVIGGGLSYILVNRPFVFGPPVINYGWTSFDLSNVSGTIISATLNLYGGCGASCSFTGCTGSTYSLHNTANNWFETTSGSNHGLSGSNPSPTNPNCPNTPGEISLIGTATWSGSGISVDVTQAINNAQANGSISVKVTNTNTGNVNSGASFCSRESSNSSLRPKLTVVTV